MTDDYVIIRFGATEYIVTGCYDEDDSEQMCVECGARKGTTCELEFLNHQIERTCIEHRILMDVRSVRCPHCDTIFGFREPKRPNGAKENFMKAKKLEDGLISIMFASAAWQCEKDKSNQSEGYSRGKYGWWIEKITPTVYGLYTQVYDGPDGDDWGSWIVRIHKGSVYVIDEQHSDSGHYFEEYFKQRYNNIPTGLTQGDLE